MELLMAFRKRLEYQVLLLKTSSDNFKEPFVVFFHHHVCRPHASSPDICYGLRCKNLATSLPHQSTLH